MSRAAHLRPAPDTADRVPTHPAAAPPSERDLLAIVCGLEREVAALKGRIGDTESLLRDAIPERRMTVTEAWAKGLLQSKPRTVSAWLYDPDLRARYRTDLLLERIGRRYYTSPARIRRWEHAMRPALAEITREGRSAKKKSRPPIPPTDTRAGDGSPSLPESIGQRLAGAGEAEPSRQR